MNLWKKEELAILRRQRVRFLERTAGHADYWRSETELALYDATFGERIGWKWDAVLAELSSRGWKPRSTRVLDWGCGSGIAARRILAHWPQVQRCGLHDRSPLARRFATDLVRTGHPQVAIEERAEVGSDTLLVLSHVLSELSTSGLAELLTLARKAGEIIWVEAGTHADSRRLICEVREALRADFTMVAPCTHQATCGLLTNRNEPHWCHHFATVPSEIFRDARWMEFGREMNIDLRALPYSFLVLQRPPIEATIPPGFSRVIGRPRESKGYSKVLSCQAEGVRELVLQKRDAPELLRAFHKGIAATTYCWTLEEGRIVGGEPLG